MKRFIARNVFLCMVAFSLSAEMAAATIIAYEGFNYDAATTLTGQSGGSGAWDTDWAASGASPSAIVQSPGLSYSVLPVSGNLADSSAATSTINFRNVGPFNSGELWLSFLARADDAAAATGPTSFFGVGTYDGSNTAAVLAIQKLGDGSSTWGLTTPDAGLSADDSTGIVVAEGETYLIVTHFKFSDAGGTVDLYVNPGLGITPPVLADATVTENVAGALNFDRIRVAAQNGRNWVFDEIRFGESFADVAIPEPTTCAMCLVALVIAGGLRQIQFKG